MIKINEISGKFVKKCVSKAKKEKLLFLCHMRERIH